MHNSSLAGRLVLDESPLPASLRVYYSRSNLKSPIEFFEMKLASCAVGVGANSAYSVGEWQALVHSAYAKMFPPLKKRPVRAF